MSRIVLSLLIVVSVSLAACHRAPDNIIRFGLASAPQNLDPRYATDAASARLNRLLYQRLVDFDEQVKPVPSLATWEVITPTRYRFHLDITRPEFHDGAALNAEDVVATFRSIIEPSTASPHAGTLHMVAAVNVLDQDTVEFILDQPDPLFPGYLAIGILPAAGIRSSHPFHEKPLGSGPFRFSGWPDPGKILLMRTRDEQVFEFQKIGDPTVRVLKLLRGEIDLLQNDLPSELLAYLARQPELQVTFGTGSNFSYIGFNMDDPLTRQPVIRKAIAHAIDRDAIIHHLLGDAARPAAAILPPDHWAGHPGLTPVAYDPALSRRLLAKAGYNEGHPLKLSYKTSTDPLRVRIATAIQQQLTDVGIQMRLQSYDWGTFYGDIKAGRFQMYSLAWVGIKTPDIFRYAFHSTSFPPHGANRGRLSDASVDQLIDAVEYAADYTSQAGVYRRVQERLLQVLPYIPLWYEDHVFVSRKEINGYHLARDGNYDALLSTRKDPN